MTAATITESLAFFLLFLCSFQAIKAGKWHSGFPFCSSAAQDWSMAITKLLVLSDALIRVPGRYRYLSTYARHINSGMQHCAVTLLNVSGVLCSSSGDGRLVIDMPHSRGFSFLICPLLRRAAVNPVP